MGGVRCPTRRGWSSGDARPRRSGGAGGGRVCTRTARAVGPRRSGRRAVGGECGVVREFRLRGKDGKYRWMLDTASVRRGESGRFAGHMGWCVDHSRWKEQEERLSQAIEASTTAMIMVDPQGRMVLVNK